MSDSSSHPASLPASQWPVGVFDSGVGGISVLRHLQALLPNERYLYLADSKHAPYGNKPASLIQQRSLAMTQFLLAQPVKAIVIACNTATAAAVSDLRQRFAALPIIAMEPAIKPAVAASRNGIIGVMATSGTLQSAQFAALLAHYGDGVQIVTQACHGLVEQIETGALQTEQTRDLLQQYLRPLLQAGADTIVLGCTHYPILKAQIQQLVGAHIQLIDTGAAVAKRLQSQLQQAQLLQMQDLSAEELEQAVTFYSNRDAADTEQLISALWGKPVQVQSLPV